MNGNGGGCAYYSGAAAPTMSSDCGTSSTTEASTAASVSSGPSVAVSSASTNTGLTSCSSTDQCGCDTGFPYCVYGLCQQCPSGYSYSGEGGDCINSNGSAAPSPICLQPTSSAGSGTTAPVSINAGSECSTSNPCSCAIPWCIGGYCSICPQGYTYSGAGGGCYQGSTEAPAGTAGSGCISPSATSTPNSNSGSIGGTPVSTGTGLASCSSTSPCSCGAFPYCVYGLCQQCPSGYSYSGEGGDCVNSNGAAYTAPSGCLSATASASTSSNVCLNCGTACTGNSQCTSCTDTYCVGGECQPCPQGCYEGNGGTCLSYPAVPGGPITLCASAATSSSTCTNTNTNDNSGSIGGAPVSTGTGLASCSSTSPCSCGAFPYCVYGLCQQCPSGYSYSGEGGDCVNSNGAAYTASSGCLAATASTGSGSGTVSTGSPLVVSEPSSGSLVSVSSAVSQAAQVDTSDVTASTPPAPAGTTKLLVISVDVTSGSSATASATMPYPCSAAPGNIAPYILVNGAWEKIGAFTINPAACTVSFQIPPDPDVGVFETGSGSTGAGSAASGCSNYCNGGGGVPSCSSSVTIATGGVQLDSCDLHETFDTLYANKGTPMTSALGEQSDISPANTVDDYNVQGAPALLTCPAAPEESPEDASYFYSGAVPYVAGDACSPLQTSDLKTTVDLQTGFSGESVQIAQVAGQPYETENCKTVTAIIPGHSWADGWISETTITSEDCTPSEVTPMIPVSAELTYAQVNPKLAVTNVGDLQLSDLSYSPQLQDGSVNTISSDFSTSSYVFDGVPAIAQHAIWTWTAQFADFSGAPPDSQQVEQDGLISNYQWTDDASCSTTIVNDCWFSYTLTSNTALTTMSNVETPFNIVTPDEGQQQVVSPVIPFFTFNAAMPTPEGQTMSQTYDVFSPLNYHDPENSIEMFPVNSPGAVLMNYGGKYLLSLPDGSLGDPTDLEDGVGFAGAGAQGWSNTLISLGLKNPELADPISITGTDTGYIYVLNESQNPTDYYLTILRPIAQGYYNTTGYQPNDMLNSMPPAASQEQWNGNWNSYWANVIALQGNSLYVVRSIDLNSKLSAYNGEINSQQGKFGGFVPINISADANGDVFMIGSEGAVIGAGLPAIVEIDTLGPDPADAGHNDASRPICWRRGVKYPY